MRVRVLVGLLAVAAIVLTLFAFSGVTAANNAAVVINDQGCWLMDGNGGVVAADSDHSVITHSGNGLLSCKVQGVPNDTGKAVHWDFDSTGASCDTPAGDATDWRETVSASGNATLTCQVK